jgi:hypothetical protein
MKAKEFYQKSHAHNLALAEHHAESAKAHRALSKLHGGDAGEHHATIAASHEALSKAHADHAGLFAACAKAAAAEFVKRGGDELMSTRVSAVAPPRAVPRAGQPTLPATLPGELAKAFSTKDEEEAIV